MTTQIEVRAFNGNKAVEVEIINVTAAGLTTERTITLKPGETSEAITLHDARRIQVREVGDFLDKPAEPKGPDPAPGSITSAPKGESVKVDKVTA